MRFKNNSGKKSKTKFIIVTIVALILVIVVGAAIVVRKSYEQNLQPLSTISKTHVVTVQTGSTTSEIAQLLKEKGVIRSDWAFEWYVRNEQLRDQLKAGTYIVDQNQSVKDIVSVIISGKVASDLVTILPGKMLSEIRQNFIDHGYTAEEVDSALQVVQYETHPALTDKPKGASLEGYLYPETFQKTADTKLSDVIKLSLDELQIRLTPQIRQEISKQGLTLHQGMTLASIIEGEVGSPEDRAQVAQVFLKRLKEGKPLQSNATDDYAKVNPSYDTYKISGLPPGPVSNFTESSLKAVAFPSQTDWLYFVSGDDKKTHFSKTFEEHEQNIQKYCTTLCGR